MIDYVQKKLYFKVYAFLIVWTRQRNHLIHLWSSKYCTYTGFCVWCLFFSLVIVLCRHCIFTVSYQFPVSYTYQAKKLEGPNWRKIEVEERMQKRIVKELRVKIANVKLWETGMSIHSSFDLSKNWAPGNWQHKVKIRYKTDHPTSGHQWQ